MCVGSATWRPRRASLSAHALSVALLTFKISLGDHRTFQEFEREREMAASRLRAECDIVMVWTRSDAVIGDTNDRQGSPDVPSLMIANGP